MAPAKQLALFAATKKEKKTNASARPALATFFGQCRSAACKWV